MAIKFFNIRSKEVRVADDEPKISALWASSDRSPNITQGQDFGWRLAPEVVVELKRIRQDQPLLLDIAKRYNVMLDDVDEKTILQYISDMTDEKDAPIAQEGDYQDEYDAEVRRLLDKQAAEDAAKLQHPTTTDTTTESLEDLQKRVELEERLAAAKAKNAGAETTTTTTVPVSTTTTTEKPTTTTTTTKAK